MKMGKYEIEVFLSYLAKDLNVSSSTQNQAFNALLFLYNQVLNKPLDDKINAIRAKRARRLPTVMTNEETQAVINALSGTQQIMAKLLYGSGLRLMECIRLRVKDIDFAMNQTVVRDGKGKVDRVTILPQSLKPDLLVHLERVKALHENDLHNGFGNVYLPYALARKYPNSRREWSWQYVFPSKSLSKDPRSGEIRRHHIHGSVPPVPEGFSVVPGFFIGPGVFLIRALRAMNEDHPVPEGVLEGARPRPSMDGLSSQ